jgi:alpha-aminoadipic semialdehyde synthase
MRITLLTYCDSRLFSLIFLQKCEGLINQVMDVIERHGCSIDFRDCNFPTNSKRQSTMSSVVLHITSSPNNQDTLDLIDSEIQTLVGVFVKANATIKRLHTDGKGNNTDQSRGVRLAQVSSSTADKKVLVLGAGFVAKSTVDLLGRSTLASIKVASDREDDARRVAKAAERGSHVALDAGNDIRRLSELINEADVVVSLLPAPMHPTVARECIRHRTHLVTASYESVEMRAMKGEVEAAGLVFLNEVGLDPGLDHMSAMKIVDDIHDRGGTITGFSSVCGGLPAPEFADNPLGYKFSWSPKGVIRASLQGARYRWEDRVMQVQEGGELLESAAPFMDAWPDLVLECLPNRDSLSYEKVYGIEGPKLNTMFRGTLRYRGFSSNMSVFQNMGLLDATEHQQDSWQKLIQELGRGFKNVDDFVLSCSDGNMDKAETTLETLRWLDVLGNRPLSASTVMDSFADVLEEKLRYKEDEYDMIVMHHTIDAVFGGDGTQERHLASLQVFGDRQRGSAMSKTVGYTTAACTDAMCWLPENATLKEQGFTNNITVSGRDFCRANHGMEPFVPPPPESTPDETGTFELIVDHDTGLSSTGIVPVHMVMIPTTTRTIMWTRGQQPNWPAQPRTEFTVSVVYDWATGKYWPVHIDSNPFCFGVGFSANGNVLAFGGEQ